MLKRLFGSKPQASTTTAPAQAVAELLFEIARSDLGIASSELSAIRKHLTQAYGLAEAQLDVLMAQAQAQVEHAISLHDTVKTVNEMLSPDDKAGLIGALWQVAYADGKIDPYEEALLRRLADLLHVSHSVFIREKLKTQT